MKVAIISKHNNISKIEDGVDCEIYDVNGLFYKELALYRGLRIKELKAKIEKYHIEEVISQAVDKSLKEELSRVSFIEMAKTNKYSALFTYIDRFAMSHKDERRPYIPQPDLTSIMTNELGTDTFDPFYTDDDDIGGS